MTTASTPHGCGPHRTQILTPLIRPSPQPSNEHPFHPAQAQCPTPVYHDTPFSLGTLPPLVSRNDFWTELFKKKRGKGEELMV